MVQSYQAISNAQLAADTERIYKATFACVKRQRESLVEILVATLVAPH